MSKIDILFFVYITLPFLMLLIVCFILIMYWVIEYRGIKKKEQQNDSN